MIFLLCCCVLPLVWYAAFRYRRRRMYELAAKIQGSRYLDLPFIGVTNSLIGDSEEIMASLQSFSRESYNNNGYLKAWLGHILYFLCTNTKDLEVILKTCLEKDDLHRFIRHIIGNGGIFAPVSIWRRRRKVLVPAFSPKIIENFVDVFSVQSEKLVERLQDCEGHGDFSLWPYVSTCTLDSVCETAMGVKVNAQGNRDSLFLLNMNKVLHFACERIFHLWLHPEWLYKLFPRSRENFGAIKMMHDFTDKVIRKKKDELKAEKEQNKDEESNVKYDISAYHRKTFLDLLIAMSGGEQGYTEKELREEVLTLTLAGTDTSAVAIGYTMKLLAKYPEVQEKVFEELYDLFGDSDRRVEKEDLTRLPYLERVVKETLRLFPPVPFIIRKVDKEISLPSGVTLPANSGVVISIWGLHRDPNHWGPEADHFDPDRFMPERFTLGQTCSFMPFSSGPRNCLGYQYALMSIKTVLASVIRKFKVIGEPEKGPIPHIRVKLDIMMKAVDGYSISLEKRKIAA